MVIRDVMWGVLANLVGRPGPAWVRSHTMQVANARVPRDVDRGHFALIGSTGSGKSTLLEILIASIFEHLPDEDDLDLFNAFIFDPQNDLYRSLMTMDLPVEVVLTNILDTRGWAWDMCRDVTDPASAWQFAYAALPEDPSAADNKFYSDAPRHIFAAVLRELVNRGVPWTLRLAYLLAMHETYAEEFCRTSADPGVRRTLRLFNENQGATRANIDSSLLTKLANLETYAALMEHAKRRFSLDELVRGEVVMVAGGDHQFNHIVGPMNYLMLTVLKQKLIGQEKSERRRHYVFIDEFAALNYNRPAEEVEDFFVRGRSRGVRIGIVIHSPEQLVDLYGKPKTNVILGQCQSKLILKVSDPDGAEYCSRLLGQVYGYEWTHSVSVNQTSGPQRSTSHGTSAQETYANHPLVHPDQIMDLPLASLEHGFHGFGIVPGATGTHKWRFHLTPRWLARHVVQGDEEISTYESCRRPGHQQRLMDLTRTEVERLGLTFDPRGERRPLPVLQEVP
jgi:hypothetical protein